MKILVLNAGSISQKSCLYEIGNTLPENPLEPLWEANIDWTASWDTARMKIEANGKKQEIQLNPRKRQEGMTKMLETLTEGETKILNELSEIEIVGHRVVHGGTEYSESVFLTAEVKEAIADLIALAPNHNPAHLEGIEAIEKVLKDVPQIAVFDTAFHSKMPPEVATYPVPYDWLELGIRRYGFHGTSHKYCSRKAAKILGKSLEDLRIVTCHLGNGCSLAAVKNGISINTTMGFTPLEGLMMGTRSGSIDAGILIFLIENKYLDAGELNLVLNKKSGLKGIFGKSGDMREVLKARNGGNEKAKLALDMYVHKLRCGIGEMVASLEGLDVLVFTAGVGENSAVVREETCKGLEFFGIKIDKQKNNNYPKNSSISTKDSAVEVLVVHTQEDWAIACECWQLISK
ncbi:MAG: acetate kinase [Okeania sp. SIO2H7]|nr:acetate kinase [Okeania sp. SIO2H7]